MRRYFSRLGSLVLAACAVLLMPGAIPAQQSGTGAQAPANGIYRGKSQILTLKGEITGGEFRVTRIIPFRGDFSRYRRIEVVRLRNLIGKDLPQKILTKFNSKLLSQFRRGGRFNSVELVGDYQPAKPGPRTGLTPDSAPASYRAAEGTERRDTTPGWVLTAAEAARFDELETGGQELTPGREAEPPTLVIVGEVLDYTAGNSLLQMIPLNLGNSDFTVRFAYYDKETGVEVGREVITGEYTAAKLLGAFHLSSALTQVGEGLVDEVSRRAAAADR